MTEQEFTDWFCKNYPKDTEIHDPMWHASRIYRRAQPVAPGECEWWPEDDENMPGTYQATCGALWTFTEDGAKENGVKFCMNCGKPAKHVLPELDDDQAFDREAEAITVAAGLGGGEVNPNATSIDDLFIYPDEAPQDEDK